MDDDAIDRLTAADLILVTDLMLIAYRAAYFEAQDRQTPPITNPKVRSLLRHVRAEHWRSIEVARAHALAEEAEPEAPRWLADLQRQRPAPTDEETEH